MLDIVFLLTALVLLALPGICLWSALFPEQDWIDRCTWGTTAGLAFAVLSAFYIAHWRLSLFWPLWTAMAVIAAALAWSRRSPPAAVSAGAARWLLLILAIVALSRFAPALVRTTPLGWDPSFHSLLARKLLLTDQLARDWSPFAPISLNYPLGSHLLVAVLSRVTRLAEPRCFQLLIPSLGVLATAQIYGLARRVFRSSEVALYSSVAYGMWAFTGGIAYYVWGGLPNQLGMVFLVPVIALACEAEWDRRNLVAMAVFLAAIFLTHHHVALVAGIVVLAMVVYLLAAPESAEVQRTRKLSGIISASVLAIIIVLPFVANEAARLRRLGETDTLRFIEPNSLFVAIAAGAVLVGGAGALGIGLCLRRENRARSALLLCISAALAAAFVLCGPVYRAYAVLRWHREYVAFAASRFFTDLVYPLSVFAGFALYWIALRARLTRRAALTIGLLLGSANAPLWLDAYRRDPQAGRFQAYAWIQQHTPPQTIVLTTDEWAAYSTWRRTLLPPIPPSEPRARDKTAAAAAAALEAGRDPGNITAVAVVAPRGAWRRGSVIWTSPSGWSVVQLWPDKVSASRP